MSFKFSIMGIGSIMRCTEEDYILGKMDESMREST